jgi:hypothetical protein
MLNVGSVVFDPKFTAAAFTMPCASAVLERILGQGEPSDAALDELHKSIEMQLAQPVTIDWLTRLRALLHQCILESNEGKWQDDHFPEAICSARSHKLILELWSEMLAAARRDPQSPFIPLRNYLATLGVQGLVPPKREFKGTRLEEFNEATREFLVWELWWVHVHSQAIAEGRGLLMCSNVAIAAERFRRREKTWPTGPEQLVPNYLSEWPNDPFDNQPIRYKVHPSGKVSIYSVGREGRDNGGKIFRPKSGPHDSNIGLELFPPEQRGLDPVN